LAFCVSPETFAVLRWLTSPLLLLVSPIATGPLGQLVFPWRRSPEELALWLVRLSLAAA
jgi:hypothetical protein